jgi:type I restriction enzyme S subunit
MKNGTDIQLPKGWEVKKLGEVCELITKGTTPTSVGFNFTSQGINFIKVESLSESGEIIQSKVAYIDEKCNQALKRSQLQENDILFSIAGALGRIGIVTREILPANTNQALAIIRLKKDTGLLVTFISRFFKCSFISDEIEKLKIGAAQQNLSLSQLNNLSIPLPPIPEQHRIVAILDRCFTAIDRAKTIASTNLQNARELFETYLNGVFEKGGKDWEVRKLGEVCEITAGGDVPKDDLSSVRTEKYNVPIFSNGEKNEGLYGYTNIAKILKPSITVSARGTIGYSMKRVQPFYPVVRLIVLTPKNADDTDLSYLSHFIKTLNFKNTGSSIPQLTVPMIKDYPIAYPSVLKQKEIVSQLDALQKETKRLEEHYTQKLHDLEELKKALLQKAFSGELVTDTIELPS